MPVFRKILDRDLGGDLRSVLAILATIAAIVGQLADFADAWKAASGGALTLTALLTVLGRWTSIGNAPKST